MHELHDRRFLRRDSEQCFCPGGESLQHRRRRLFFFLFLFSHLLLIPSCYSHFIAAFVEEAEESEPDVADGFLRVVGGCNVTEGATRLGQAGGVVVDEEKAEEQKKSRNSERTYKFTLKE